MWVKERKSSCGPVRVVDELVVGDDKEEGCVTDRSETGNKGVNT
jgi:hypothetical protein